MPFQFNAGGETVVASTSPFWTILLVLFFKVTGTWTPLLLTVAVLLIWLISAYLLYHSATELWNFPKVAVWSLLLLWLLHTTIVANALGGLENVLSALQLLMLYTLTARYRDGLTVRRALLLGLLTGWALLTRPDGGMFALILVALYFLALWPTIRRRPAIFAGHLAVIVSIAFLVLLPWYAYQYNEIGQLVSDSTIARLYGGRQGSLVLIPGLLYLHPKVLVSLVTAFLPLVVGYLITGTRLARCLTHSPGARLQLYREEYPRYAAVLLVITGLLFYTLVVGAEAFGRYFLPLFPFMILAGVDGWVRLFRWMAVRYRRHTAVTVVLLAAMFMILTSVVDFYRRLGPGSFSSDHILSVIYGPANGRYFSVNLPAVLTAPQHRSASTTELLAHLGATDDEELSSAVTEVQLRYFVDNRIEIISLDGRSSSRLLDYIEPVTGVPDFGRYFLDMRPDYVHSNQWCEVGGWMSAFSTMAIRDNLVCRWEKQAARMEPGDSFRWQGCRVTLASPEILRIEWCEDD
jgi:hypothetical protein